MEHRDYRIKKLINDLNERQKESSCLYKVTAILNHGSVSVKDNLIKVAEVLPQGFQFPDICKVQILYNGKVIQAEEFQPTELKLSTKIKLDDTEDGELNVFYTKPGKDRIFLHEEHLLVNEIAEKISQFITISHFRELSKNTRELSLKFNIPIRLGKWLSEWQLQENEIHRMLGTKVDFKKGDLIFKQNVLASYMVIFTDGLAQVFVEDDNNHSYTFRLIKPFEFIGLSCIFSSGHYGFTASAINPSTGYLVNLDTIKSLIEHNQKFNFELIKWYSENLNFTFRRLNFLANKQSLGRISETLLYLWRDVFDLKLIESGITRKIIAELSGMSTENAIRIMSELKNDGIINTKKEGIEILKPDLLHRFSISG